MKRKEKTKQKKDGQLNLLSSSNRDEFSVSLAAETALCFSSNDSSRGETSAFSNSILSQLRYVASQE